MSELLGEYLDRLITTKMTVSRSRILAEGKSSRPGDYLIKMYDWAREKTGGPLTYLAAKSLIDTVKKGDFVFLMAEAAYPPYLYVGETDGPMGAAVLARMLDVAFEAKPVLIASPDKVDANIAVWNAAELEFKPKDVVQKREHGGSIAEPLPIDDVEAKKIAIELVEKYNPVAMISVETLAVNAKGHIHCMTGSDSTPYVMKAQHLIDEAKKKGILTIGIGDGGNEIGFGTLYDELRTFGGMYTNCQPNCTCGDGVTTVVETDLILPTAVSNWGAYGIEACIAAMVSDLDVMHNELIEKRILMAGVDAGLACGSRGKRMLSVDGVSPEAGQALITILREMVKNFLKKYKKRGF